MPRRRYVLEDPPVRFSRTACFAAGPRAKSFYDLCLLSESVVVCSCFGFSGVFTGSDSVMVWITLLLSEGCFIGYWMFYMGIGAPEFAMMNARFSGRMLLCVAYWVSC